MGCCCSALCIKKDMHIEDHRYLHSSSQNQSKVHFFKNKLINTLIQIWKRMQLKFGMVLQWRQVIGHFLDFRTIWFCHLIWQPCLQKLSSKTDQPVARATRPSWEGGERGKGFARTRIDRLQDENTFARIGSGKTASTTGQSLRGKGKQMPTSP